MLTETLCPCCGSPMTSERAIGATVQLSKLERRIFDRLTLCFGKWVPVEALMHACYWDRADGGPDNGQRAISSTLRELRKKLHPIGMRIEWSSGPANDGRRLVWATPAMVKKTLRGPVQAGVSDGLEALSA